MMIWVIVGLATFAALGVPYLPLLIAGALAICAVAFYLTRIKHLVTLAFCVVLFSMIYVINAQPVFQQEVRLLPTWLEFMNSDMFLGGLAVVVIVYAVAIGMFGPLAGLPTDGTGVLKRVKGAEKNRQYPEDGGNE